jgi:hypothetical protein
MKLSIPSIRCLPRVTSEDCNGEKDSNTMLNHAAVRRMHDMWEILVCGPLDNVWALQQGEARREWEMCLQCK